MKEKDAFLNISRLSVWKEWGRNHLIETDYEKEIRFVRLGMLNSVWEAP